MTTTDSGALTSPSGSTDDSVTLVVRDPSFVRTTADQVTVMFLGRDIELACLTSSPRILSQRDGDEADERVGEFTLKQVLNETVRVRMAPESAINLALNIIGELAPTGRLQVSALQEAIAAALRTAPDAENQEASS